MATTGRVGRFIGVGAVMESNLPLRLFEWSSIVGGLSAIEEGGDGCGAGVLELLLAFGVEEIAVSVDDGQGGNAFGDGDVVLLRDIDVLVHVTDVDVDEDKVFGDELGVGTLAIVDVEELAVAAPGAAE